MDWALKQRHKLLVAEMNLRGYIDRSPVLLRSKPGVWPEIYIDEPAQQISILHNKYKYLESGRIPLPKNAQTFWAHHKYSSISHTKLNSLSNKALLKGIQLLSLANNVKYLNESTSLSELNAWTL